jgi:hypothetical protein
VCLGLDLVRELEVAVSALGESFAGP